MVEKLTEAQRAGRERMERLWLPRLTDWTDPLRYAEFPRQGGSIGLAVRSLMRRGLVEWRLHHGRSEYRNTSAGRALLEKGGKG